MWPSPAVQLTQRDTIRLISTGRLKEPVLLPLAANQGALDDLADLESVTNGRLQEESGLTDLDPRELVFGRAGHTCINAAFAHPRLGGNRFNGEDRGAWYCGFDVATSLGEACYHLTRELKAIGRFENITDYAELVADVFGPFHDLRAAEPALQDDPALAIPRGRLLRSVCARNSTATSWQLKYCQLAVHSTSDASCWFGPPLAPLMRKSHTGCRFLAARP